jgi:hypothetical protein
MGSPAFLVIAVGEVISNRSIYKLGRFVVQTRLCHSNIRMTMLIEQDVPRFTKSAGEPDNGEHLKEGWHLNGTRSRRILR